jgi:hypothetical protein
MFAFVTAEGLLIALVVDALVIALLGLHALVRWLRSAGETTTANARSAASLRQRGRWHHRPAPSLPALVGGRTSPRPALNLPGPTR